MSDWPPGPPGSGMSRLNDPRYAHELQSTPVELRGPESARRVEPAPGSTTSEAPAARSAAPSVAVGASEAIAVLVPAGLRTMGGGFAAATTSSAQVLHQASIRGIRQIWIGPQMIASLGLPFGLNYKLPPLRHPWLGDALRAGWGAEPAGLAPWIELRRQEGDRLDRMELVFPSWDESGNPFAGATSAGELLAALELFARHVGLRYRWSPGATGLALMRQVHSGRGGVELPEVGTPAPIAVEHKGALDSWASRSWLTVEPDGVWMIASWVHAWDINGMYLAAASSAELGFGEAAHTKVRGSFGAIGGAAGYWRAIVRPRAIKVALPFKTDGRAHWYTTPAIHYLTELGYKPRILEAWTYPQRRRWLEPWYERLREARTALAELQRPAGALALRALKLTYAAALGRLAGSWLKAGDATFRPDWRHVVIDRARINLHRHLLRAQRSPIGLDEDTALWICGSPDPAAAAGQVGLEVSDQLGKWKHRGAADSGQAIAALQGAGASTSKRLAALLEALEAPR